MIDKMIDPNIAINAYSNSSKISGRADSGDGEGVSFSDLLKKQASESIDAMRASERVSAQAVMGEADLTDVVQAVNNAEITLQTVVSVRDRLVSAYQDIMRMPI